MNHPPENEEQELEEFSEYFEGLLSEEKRQALEERWKTDTQLTTRYQAFVQTMEALRAMQTPAPIDVQAKVKESIHKRSGGRFFGKRAFGERIPYELIATAFMFFALGIMWLARSPKEAPKDIPPQESQEVLPRFRNR